MRGCKLHPAHLCCKIERQALEHGNRHKRRATPNCLAMAAQGKHSCIRKMGKDWAESVPSHHLPKHCLYGAQLEGDLRAGQFAKQIGVAGFPVAAFCKRMRGRFSAIIQNYRTAMDKRIRCHVHSSALGMLLCENSRSEVEAVGQQPGP